MLPGQERRAAQRPVIYDRMGNILSGPYEARRIARLAQTGGKLVLPHQTEKPKNPAIYGPTGELIRRKKGNKLVMPAGLFVVATPRTALSFMQKHALASIVSGASDRSVQATGWKTGSPLVLRRGENMFDLHGRLEEFAGGLQVPKNMVVRPNEAIQATGLMSLDTLKLLSELHAETPYSKELVAAVARRTVELPTVNQLARLVLPRVHAKETKTRKNDYSKPIKFSD